MRKTILLFLLFSCLSHANDADSLKAVPPHKVYETTLNHYRGFGDLLLPAPDIQIRDTGTFGQWSTMLYRGSDAHHSTVFFDGILLEDPWTGIADLNLIPVDFSDSFKTGYADNGAIVSPVGTALSVAPADIDESGIPRTTVTYRFGSENFSDTQVFFGQQFTKVFNLMAGAAMQGYGAATPDEHYEGLKIFSRLQFDTGTLGFTYTLLHNKTDIDLPYSMILPGDTLITLSPHRKTNRTDHLVRSFLRTGPHRTDVYFQYSDIEHEFRDSDFNPLMRYPGSLMRAGLNQHIDLPVDLSMNIESRLRRMTGPDDIHYSSLSFQGGLNAKYSLFSRLYLSAGIHGLLDGNRNIQPSLNGAARLKLSPSLNVHLGYRGGVREVTLAERYNIPVQILPPSNLDFLNSYSAITSYRENNLKPEISERFEAGIDVNGPMWIRAGLTGHLTAIDRIITPDIINDTLRFINGKRSELMGADIKINCKLPWNFTFDITGAYLSAEDQYGVQMLERPSLSAWSMLGWKGAFFQDDLKVHAVISFIYRSDSWGAGDLLADKIEPVYLDAAFLLNAKIRLTIMQNADVSAGLENILSSETYLIAHHLISPMTFRVGLRWTVFD